MRFYIYRTSEPYCENESPPLDGAILLSKKSERINEYECIHYEWVIDIDTLDHLLEIAEKSNHSIILIQGDIWSLEIYDDYINSTR